MSAPNAILTIGHSTRNIEEFIGLLAGQDVKRVIDVRKMPRSARNPQFNSDALAQSLGSAHIGYTHLPELGGLRRTRPDSPNTGWRNLSFRGFADYMQSAEFEKGLQKLIEAAASEQVAILCAEAVPGAAIAR